MFFAKQFRQLVRQGLDILESRQEDRAAEGRWVGDCSRFLDLLESLDQTLREETLPCSKRIEVLQAIAGRLSD